MRLFVCALALFATNSAFAAARCYQLSPDGEAWSRTPEVLCVDDKETGPSEITLATGIGEARKIVATYNFDLLQRARCVDCNQDVYGVAVPSNSIFNELKITFDGAEDLFSDEREEKGTITIGAKRLHYRSYNY